MATIQNMMFIKIYEENRVFAKFQNYKYIHTGIFSAIICAILPQTIGIFKIFLLFWIFIIFEINYTKKTEYQQQIYIQSTYL